MSFAVISGRSDSPSRSSYSRSTQVTPPEDRSTSDLIASWVATSGGSTAFSAASMIVSIIRWISRACGSAMIVAGENG